MGVLPVLETKVRVAVRVGVAVGGVGVRVGVEVRVTKAIIHGLRIILPILIQMRNILIIQIYPMITTKIIHN